jgi:hypothetical protein
MRASAELHPDVVWYLQHACTPAEVVDFRRELERVCEAPIRRSEVFHDRELSRYVLRRFSFGTGVEKFAIFRYDGQTVQVLTCRPAKPKRLREPRDPGEPEPR